MVISGLRKSFGEVKAVQGVDISIAPSSTVALLGPNGAGKTTTIDMLLGLQRPDAGRCLTERALNPYSTPEPVRPLMKALWTAINTRIIGSVTMTTEAKITFCGVISP